MDLKSTLEAYSESYGLIINIDYRRMSFIIFDFSTENKSLENIDVSNTEEFNKYIKKKLSNENAVFGIGKYNENRLIYNNNSLFGRKRSIHLGIDLWVTAGTEVLCPIDGTVHSYKNNKGNGDYGPTVILEHEIEGIRFYTLYGHLSLESLNDMEVGKKLSLGDRIGWVGDFPVNGNWPPHLHFQIIKDMLGHEGDFPGVCSIEDRELYLDLCPDPNLILQIEGLE